MNKLLVIIKSFYNIHLTLDLCNYKRRVHNGNCQMNSQTLRRITKNINMKSKIQHIYWVHKCFIDIYFQFVVVDFDFEVMRVLMQ